MIVQVAIVLEPTDEEKSQGIGEEWIIKPTFMLSESRQTARQEALIIFSSDIQKALSADPKAVSRVKVIAVPFKE